MFFTITAGCEESWPGLNYDLFKNTFAERLADAVQKENIHEIEYLVKEEKIPVNFQEPEGGETLLKVAILTQKKQSIKKLLELGADPNIRDRKFNQSPFHFACAHFTVGITDIELIDLLLKYGADINTPQTYKHSNGTYYRTPLCLSVDISERFRKDQLFYFLIKKGADINHFSPDSSGTILQTVAMHNRVDLARFLVIDKKCKIPSTFNIIEKGTKNEKKESFTKFLQRQEYKKNSNNESIRNEILKYLSRGHVSH